MFKNGQKVIIPFGFYQTEGTILKTVKRDYEDPIFLVDVEGDEVWINSEGLRNDDSK